MNIVFFGSSKYVLPVIEVLKNNFNLKLVVTTEKNPTDSVINYCSKNNIECISTLNINNNIKSKLKTLDAKIAVVASFGVIIPQDVLDLFPKGILNIHPSLLPKYRGTTPVQTAILNNDKKTGVSIMLLDKEMDHGPILEQQTINLSDTETSDTLYTQLFKIGSQMLAKLIPLFLEDKIALTAQNHENASFTKPLTRDSGYIEINDKLTTSNHYFNASNIKQAIKALYPWPGVWTKYKLSKNGNEKIIKLLPENKIQVEGKKPMNIKDFINGYENAKEFLAKIGLN